MACFKATRAAMGRSARTRSASMISLIKSGVLVGAEAFMRRTLATQDEEV